MGARGSEMDQDSYARFIRPGITQTHLLSSIFPWDGFNVHARVMDVICASVSRERGGEDSLNHTVKPFFLLFYWTLFILLSDDGLTGHYAFAEFQHSDFAPTS